MKNTLRFLFFCLLLLSSGLEGYSQHSVARQWNEVLLDAIRNDYARPTVHARNLFHTSVLLYDCWAVYEEDDQTYFLGQEHNGFVVDFTGVPTPVNKQAYQEEAMSYAAYRLLRHRFQNSPGASSTIAAIDQLFSDLGYNSNNMFIDYTTGSPAALGNYIADKMIEYGLLDGSNEVNDYANEFYTPFNTTLLPVVSGNPDIVDPNRWQPLSLDTYVDQSGNVLPNSTPEFLSPEWGKVYPFALEAKDLSVLNRDGEDYYVYHDPGMPVRLDQELEKEDYQWGFGLVAKWSSHLDTTDGVMWDISPGSLGNLPIEEFPTTSAEYKVFYNEEAGGDPSQGYAVNPVTGQAYEPQMVKRGDYTRVLAEFWADGPDSETPPGHWFTILNYVSDHALFEKRMEGKGEELDDLEWDVKSYLALGGAMHDAAVTAWGIKGWYDYIRPICAIRHMCDLGQCTNPSGANYNENGIALDPGYIELVEIGDPLAGSSNEHVGKIKVLAWRGPDYIADPAADVAGVGWILAENWWPYQRPSFVTPPFAGYVSGHSVFSRAAAEVMTSVTGSSFFPGGMGEFVAKKDEFLVFENGPSTDVILQWATYQDASDQTSLSRIWGGIHPPIDDVPGRLMGEKIGQEAFVKAKSYFNQKTTALLDEVKTSESLLVYPNPVKGNTEVRIKLDIKLSELDLVVTNAIGEVIIVDYAFSNGEIIMATNNWEPGMYLVKVVSQDTEYVQKVMCE